MAGGIRGITVKIGGDTTELGRSLSEASRQSTSLQRELKGVNTLLKFDPGNVTLLQQKAELLKKSIQETKQKLNDLVEVQRKVDAGEIEMTEEEYRNLQREIVATQQRVEQLNDEQREFGSVGAQQVAVMGEKLQDLGGKVEEVGRSFSKISAVSGAVLTGSILSASNFTDAMAKVNTIADTSAVSLEELSDQILELSNQTGISAEEIADATYNAISAGQNTADAVNFVSNATALAKAGFTDTGSAIDVLTTIMNAYGLEADKVGSVSDMLIQTQNKGKTTVAELSSSMGKIIPTANSMGVSLDQLCAGYAIMTANGIATAETTTYMNSMLNELGKSTTNVGKILKEKTGKSFQELVAEGNSVGDVLKILQDYADDSGTAFNELWGSAEAGKAGLTLLSGGVNEFNNMVSGMSGAVGSTSQALEKLDTPSQKAKEAMTQLKNAGITLGQQALTALTPLIEKVSKAISDLTSWFSGLSPEVQRVILIVLAVVTALGPALIIIGKIITAVGTIMTIVPSLVSAISAIKGGFIALNAVLMANPIILIVTLIAGLVAGLIYAYTHCEKFRNIVNVAFKKVKEVAVNALSTLVNFFTVTIPNAFNTVINFIKGNWQGLLLFIVNPFAGAFKLLYDNCGAFRNFINKFVDGIKTIVTKKIPEFLKDLPYKLGYLLGKLITKIALFGLKVTKWINTNVPIFIKNVIDFIKKLPGKVFEWLVKTLVKVTTWGEDMKAKAKEIAKEFLEKIKEKIKELPGKIKEKLDDAIEKVKQWKDDLKEKGKEAIKDMIDGIKEKAQSIPEDMKEIGKNIVAGVWNGIQNAKEKFMSDVKGFFSGIVSGAKSELEIHSPSRVFAREVGKWIPEGVASGIKDNSTAARDAIKGMTGGMLDTGMELNGATLNRKLSATFKSSTSGSGINATQLMNSLNDIYNRLDNLTVVLDTGKLIGGIVDPMDSALSVKNKKVVRGW